MAVDDALLEAEELMEKALNHLNHELRALRTGRASPALVEHIKVDYYGSPTDIKSIAAINVPEATQILIKPFNPQDLRAIEKAISESKLGLSGSSDGKSMRINLPPMSMDRRVQLATQAKGFGETAKISIRGARRDANKAVDQMEKDGELNEDGVEAGKEQVQELTKQYENKVDATIEKKRSDIMDV